MVAVKYMCLAIERDVVRREEEMQESTLQKKG